MGLISIKLLKVCHNLTRLPNDDIFSAIVRGTHETSLYRQSLYLVMVWGTLYPLAFKKIKESIRGLHWWVCSLEEWEVGGNCSVVEIPHRKSHASLVVIYHTFTSSSVIIWNEASWTSTRSPRWCKQTKLTTSAIIVFALVCDCKWIEQDT